ncbi:MAG: Asp-tRNA(Asn)/Glu-tRNA(Gln) amidotransferase subunit GatB [Magnetococcales bacterium]|nr:Asp-tRNA(Asn)/Glu-tRNA(Gln) amidotransferase subunit GatB [Magnetococcales bacterium]
MNQESAYSMVIGLEVHAQMLTQSKIFCGCPTQFGAAPNTQVCPVCAAFPGVLPVLNHQAVEMALRTGLAINGHINRTSEFSRKNYFYPDLPAGFQITQYEHPIVEAGELFIEPEGQPRRRIGITRIHIEVDAGKSLHEGIPGASWVDLNRTGTPLMEIVSEPDLRTPEEAGEYLKNLRSLLRYLGVCDGNMEQGSLRCDANVSVRTNESAPFGTRCELKNLNSIRNVMRAIVYEAERQVGLIENGEKVVQETRLWDPDKGVTRSMRGKEDAHDYRYFPEPDLPLLVLTEARIDKARAALPELPEAKRLRYMQQFGLSSYDASVLTADKDLATYFEAVIDMEEKGVRPEAKSAANWVQVELLGRLNREGHELSASPVPPQRLGKLLLLVQNGTISGKMAKEVFQAMFESGQEPEGIIEARGLKQVSDTGTIEGEIRKILDANPAEVEQYRQGKTKVFGFFVGQVMKATRGQANPQMVNDLLKQMLAG